MSQGSSKQAESLLAEHLSAVPMAVAGNGVFGAGLGGLVGLGYGSAHGSTMRGGGRGLIRGGMTGAGVGLGGLAGSYLGAQISPSASLAGSILGAIGGGIGGWKTTNKLIGSDMKSPPKEKEKEPATQKEAEDFFLTTRLEELVSVMEKSADLWDTVKGYGQQAKDWVGDQAGKLVTDQTQKSVGDWWGRMKASPENMALLGAGVGAGAGALGNLAIAPKGRRRPLTGALIGGLAGAGIGGGLSLAGTWDPRASTGGENIQKLKDKAEASKRTAEGLSSGNPFNKATAESVGKHVGDTAESGVRAIEWLGNKARNNSLGPDSETGQAIIRSAPYIETPYRAVSSAVSGIMSPAGAIGADVLGTFGDKSRGLNIMANAKAEGLTNSPIHGMTPRALGRATSPGWTRPLTSLAQTAWHKTLGPGRSMRDIWVNTGLPGVNLDAAGLRPATGQALKNLSGIGQAGSFRGFAGSSVPRKLVYPAVMGFDYMSKHRPIEAINANNAAIADEKAYTDALKAQGVGK